VSDMSRYNIDVASLFQEAQSQFQGLNPNEPGQWPLLPKVAAFAGTVFAVLLLGWVLLLQAESTTLDDVVQKEPQLKAEYNEKLAKAVNLAELSKQRVQVQEYVNQLEKQLPGKAEMDALLSDINQAGLGRGLEFQLFKPGQVEVKDYYAELPITIKVSGRFHDVGAFASDIANLSRIVTLHNITITTQSGKESSGGLMMDAVARTYRYLDAAEVESQRVAKSKARRGNGAARADQEGAKP
jgi:type IV pilus assembly protein PilO